MPKFIDHEEKKQEIISGAIQVFVQKGYFQTKFSDIAKKCGMGRTTLYHYFKNKDEIFQVVLQNLFDSLKNDFEKVVDSTDYSSLEKVKGIISTVTTEFGKEHNKVIILIELKMLLGQEKSVFIEKINEYSGRLRKVLVGLLEAGMWDGEIRQVDAESMAFALTVLVESFILQLSFASDFSLQDHLNNIYLFLDGLKARAV